MQLLYVWVPYGNNTYKNERVTCTSNSILSKSCDIQTSSVVIQFNITTTLRKNTESHQI